MSSPAFTFHLLNGGKIIYAFELIKRLVDGQAVLKSVVRSCMDGWMPSGDTNCNSATKRYFIFTWIFS